MLGIGTNKLTTPSEAHHRGQYSPGVMIERMPQPPCPRFGTDDTLHLIELGGAWWPHAHGA
jgi:hypothetical protein